MPEAAAQQQYDRAEALRMLNLSERQLRSWEKAGLVPPAQGYDFGQLVVLRALVRLKEANQPPARIRKAIDAIRARLSEGGDPLARFKLYAEGKKIRVQLGGSRMESDSGQLLLNFDDGELERMVTLPQKRADDKADERRKQAEAEKLFLRGVELEQTGAPVEHAIEAYQNAVALDPGLAAAYVNLGTIYFTAQRLDQAEKYYRRAVEANPQYPLAHFNLGNLHDERGQRDDALRHYLTAIRLDSGYADAHYNLALLHQGRGEVMKAIRHWRAYLKLDPASNWAQVARRELDKLTSSAVVRGDGPRRGLG